VFNKYHSSINQSEISLYIHFPFCRKKCGYCDFYSIDYNPTIINQYIKSLKNEWLLISDKWDLKNSKISTIYFGGGTPSLINEQQWNLLISELILRLNILPDVEWTIECNPESFSEIKAEMWLHSGVNRFTIGVQSLNALELESLGRIHTVESVIETLSNPVLKKFKSVNIDLMYGIPLQSIKSLEDTLYKTISYNCNNHFSIYELSISKNTRMGRTIDSLILPSEDEVLEMTVLVQSITKMHGFNRYEVSNYAKMDYKCRHNLAYWNHAPYIGLGPSAHSFIQGKRFANISNIDEYCTMLSRNETPVVFTETINNEKLSHELIFLGLRTNTGINELSFFEYTGEHFKSKHRENIIDEFIAQGYLEYTPPFYTLTDKGIIIADSITERLL